MNKINLIKPEKVNILNHPALNEKWVQEIIASDPSILGLGDLILKDKERNQPRAGRQASYFKILIRKEDMRLKFN